MLFDIFGFIKRFKIPFIYLFAILLAILLFLYLSSGETILKGVTIENVDVSGLSVTDANKVLSDSFVNRYSGNSLILKYGDRQWELSLKDIDFRFLIGEAVSRAYNLSRPTSVFERALMRVKLSVNGQALKIGTYFDRDRLAVILNKIKNELDFDEADAAITYNKGKISFKQDIIGSSLDVQKNLNLLENQLMNRNFGNLNLMVDEIFPAISYNDIKDINHVLSNFFTSFNRADTNRSDNIRLACSRLNGRILMPGEEFSMNDTLGTRTVENGYKEAPVILKNELVAGTGGGICQVTTTLYDTVLLAKLDVLERSHHSMPLAYVKPGQDATISEGSIDFRFANNQDYPVCLSTEVRGNVIYIRMLGRQSQDKTVEKLVPVVIAEYPPGKDEIQFDDSLPFGQKVIVKAPRKGVRAILYRDTYSDGKLIQREQISEDYYEPTAGLIKINSNYYPEYITITEGSLR